MTETKLIISFIIVLACTVMFVTENRESLKRNFEEFWFDCYPRSNEMKLHMGCSCEDYKEANVTHYKCPDELGVF